MLSCVYGGKYMEFQGMNGVSEEAEYLYRQAREKVDEGEYQHAVTILHRAIEISPHHSHALIALGNCYDYLNQYDDAISFFEKVIGIDPFYADAWFNKGVSLKKMGRDKDALPCIEKAIELFCGR
jgi:tetratricopeptide (TPR) repeat protein